MGSIIPVVKIPVPHPPLPEEQWPSGPSILAVNDAYERYTPDLALAPSFAHYWMVVEYVNLDGTVDADDLPKFREAMLKVQEMEKEYIRDWLRRRWAWKRRIGLMTMEQCDREINKRIADLEARMKALSEDFREEHAEAEAAEAERRASKEAERRADAATPARTPSAAFSVTDADDTHSTKHAQPSGSARRISSQSAMHGASLDNGEDRIDPLKQPLLQAAT
ncbi:unnamed protein product [Vitrella brassicaformis CCMP3155]|uniref:Uncharacterized protein n=2 Tax=Vitrella brassicaformis TaxID=1169539 RepID=A0A0G4GB24_VITBC|nr:unnamed protein product [Vitrella brassicaformis CCMP3155]|mmetsp:Transcript_23238/g.57487  ORF Transcript_23238/g.57487 Transcript_23238/m.57487 type:complete len:222 (+) Transcript_23238:133-798(+)|eukprot:CEM26328.1 unnamed protein product [Vitrella brassicaformis CCMP3155]